MLSASLATSACSSSSSGDQRAVFVDGGGDGTAVDAGTDVVIGTSTGGPDGRRSSRSRTRRIPGPGAFYVTISGESNALTGYPFPPDNFSSDTYMPDGWEFEILEYIVVVDKITLWSNPNQSATNQSQHGSPVAHLDGPFVVDLHKGGKIVGPGRLPRAVDAPRRHHEPERQRQRGVRHDGRHPVRLRLQHGAGDVRRVQREPRPERGGRLRAHGAEGLLGLLPRHGRVEGERPGQSVRRCVADERGRRARTRGSSQEGDARGPDVRRTAATTSRRSTS